MVGPVSESNLPPESWRPLFDRAGIEFGYRPLASRAGLTHTRVHRLVRGGGTTDDAIEKVADALRVKPSKVRELRGEAAVDRDPFTLPDEAGRLTDSERRVIRSMVRALLDARELGDEDTSTQTASEATDAGGSAGVRTPITRAADGGDSDNVHALNQWKQGPTPAPDFDNPGELAAARTEPGYTKSGKRDRGSDKNQSTE